MNPSDVQKFESLSETTYSSANQEQRKLAETQMAAFDTPESIPNLQFILQQSKNAYALFFASSKLLKLFTFHWNLVTAQQKTEMSLDLYFFFL